MLWGFTVNVRLRLGSRFRVRARIRVIFQYSLLVSESNEMRFAFPLALVPFHASETVENQTKNRKFNNYLGYLREFGWMFSAALYNTWRNINLVSKKGEWNETWWINENIENADVNNSLITNVVDVAHWNILLGKTERSWATNSQSELPHSPKGVE